MFDDTTEDLSALMHKGVDGLVSDGDTQGQRIDKHTETLGDTYITTAITDCRQVNTMVGSITCYRVEDSSQHHCRRGDFLLLGIVADSIHIKG